MNRKLVPCFAAACIFNMASMACISQQPVDRSVKLNGGLIGHVVKIGHSTSRSQISATITIENAGSTTAYLAQVGVATSTDNIGNTYRSTWPSGIGYCNADETGAASACLGIGNPSGPMMRLQAFTRVDPGRTITINLTFPMGNRVVGPSMAITMNVLGRFVLDPDRDLQIPDSTKYQQFNLMNVGFPAIPVQEQ